MRIERPSLEYQYLFDYCASVTQGQAQLIAEQAFFLNELKRRIPETDPQTAIWVEGNYRQESSPKRLIVVQPGWLVSLLPHRPSRKLLPDGYEIEKMIGFHGWRSILWSQLFGLARRVGRFDLADRCLQAMRLSYVEQGLAARLSTLVVLVATHKEQA